jgi:hypothetical protein
VHGGKWAVRLQRDAASGSNFSTITIGIPVDFAGTSLEFRGFIKTQDVSEFAGLWMREDGDGGPVAFDNMQSKHLNGTHDWTEYSDDLQLLMDGKAIWAVPKVERPKTAIDLDHEFDGGSGIKITDLSKAQN